MITIELIKKAIEDADNMRSPHAFETYDVPALTSLKIRHLLNNLGALGTIFLECGCHRGGTFTATVAGNTNLKEAIAIDSFESDLTSDAKAQPDFKANAIKHIPEKTKHTLIVSDTFKVDLSELPKGIDIYTYDGDHSHDYQRKALTYFLPVLADEFIFICDDWDFPEVKSGTKQGLIDGNFDILFEWTVDGNDHDNDNFWNGLYVALLKKSKSA